MSRLSRISLSRRDRLLIGGIALLGLLAAYWFLAIAPKRSEAGKLQTKIDKNARSLAQSKAVLESYQGDKVSYQANYAAIVRLGKAVPATTDMPSLIIQLSRAARKARIDFRRIATQESPTPPTPATTPAPTTGAGSSGGSSSGSSGQQASSGSSQGSGDNSGQSTGGAQSPGAVSAANNAAQQGSQSAASAQPTGSAQPAQSGASAAAPAADAANAVFTAVPIQFTFQGSFFDLDNFLRRIRSLVAPSKARVAVSGRLLVLNGLDFSAGTRGFPQVKATIAATAYITPRSQGLTAGATPSGPAGVGGGGTTQTSAPAGPPATATATGVKP